MKAILHLLRGIYGLVITLHLHFYMHDSCHSVNNTLNIIIYLRINNLSLSYCGAIFPWYENTYIFQAHILE